ncbi:hypothetical protein K239x_07110 [Planctomycetes bacterium K23_9]|uniref:DUF2585 family protein n=2 Tax=Stieleria marina TaxID=1930275 RepID=A0A517NNR4_9BACT|nr:hypothetical protein K239x_07110 [Planctomycetes bacterium K23_9]
MCAVLTAMGRCWWCEAGDYLPWSWDVWSRHNSQHLVDPYALSHIEHGIGLFLLLTFFAAKITSTSSRIVVVAAVEGIWEIAENTPLMINRCREATVSLDYFGDSVLNSLSDLGMCLLGALLVVRLKWKRSIAVFVLLEIVSILWIRDSLLLNILMLLSPVEAIKTWQAGA